MDTVRNSIAVWGTSPRPPTAAAPRPPPPRRPSTPTTRATALHPPPSPSSPPTHFNPKINMAAWTQDTLPPEILTPTIKTPRFKSRQNPARPAPTMATIATISTPPTAFVKKAFISLIQDSPKLHRRRDSFPGIRTSTQDPMQDPRPPSSPPTFLWLRNSTLVSCPGCRRRRCLTSTPCGPATRRVCRPRTTPSRSSTVSFAASK